MEIITLYDKNKKLKVEEKVYFKNTLEFLYNGSFLSRFFVNSISRFSFFSKFIGFINNLKISKYKIKSFIEHFQIDEKEFEKKTSDFRSFNDFFIRKLNKNARSIDPDENVLVFPCDGRFLAIPNINDFDFFEVKNQRFNIFEFLNDKNLADQYKNGSMLLCRLAPQDYHRFYFPSDCIPSESKLINGHLYSVNPIALKKNIKILSQNKRMITTLKTKNFSDVLYIEIGATNVGSINQSFFPNTEYKKGEEKGYFSLGGSSIVLLFKKDTIVFDQDLVEMSKERIETLAHLGLRFASKKERS
ncbi:MAG: archaetidylserine decarboxylase [Parachlamydiales bacterium]|jgi:phosphatidylserine decarboxylase